MVHLFYRDLHIESLYFLLIKTGIALIFDFKKRFL